MRNRNQTAAAPSDPAYDQKQIFRQCLSHIPV